MEREIKFRVWDKNVPKDWNEADENKPTGEMIDWDYVIDSCYLKDGLLGKFPIMQYTGLKDKNNKEIYEGDIIQWEEDGKKHTAEVIFDCGSFCYDECLPIYVRVNHPVGILYDLNNPKIVVGNIYENPNL